MIGCDRRARARARARVLAIEVVHPDVKDDILMDLALLRSLATFAESRVASWRYLGLLDTAEVKKSRREAVLLCFTRIFGLAESGFPCPKPAHECAHEGRPFRSRQKSSKSKVVKSGRK